jgi:hypothetical protein
MQDLWLRTRIRRDDYAFLGDLRKLAARSKQDAKVNWARVHLAVADRLAAWRAAQPTWMLPEPMVERLEAVLQAVGTRAAAVGTSVGERGDAVRQSVRETRRRLGRRAVAYQAALADLRLLRLPPLRPDGWLLQAASRLNVLSMRHLEAHHSVREYWERTWSAALRLRFWRLNPFAVSWNLARDTRQAVVFLRAMIKETY